MTPWHQRTGAVGAAVLTLLAWLVAPSARAAEEVATRAQALFEEGRRLLLEGDYERACAALAESQLEEPAAGTLLNLAFCHEQLGRTATAYVEYQHVLVRSVGAGDEARAALVRERLAALEPRLVRLRIRLPPDGGAGTVLELDGARLRPEDLDAPIPVDPGRHRLGGVAAGERQFELEVVAEQPGVTLEVPVPPPAPPAGDAPGTRPEAGATAVGRTRLEVAAPRAAPARGPPPAARAAGASTTPAGVSVATLAVGVLGLGAGAYFGLEAFEAWAQRDRHCTRDVCDEVAEAAYRRARRSATASNLCFAVGAASGAAGLYFVFRSTSRSTSSPEDRTAGEASALLIARGRF